MKKLVVRFLMLLFVLGMSTNVAWGSGAFNSLVQQLQQEVYFAELTAAPSVSGSGKVYIAGKTEQSLPAEFDWSAQEESSTVSRGVGAVVEGMDMVQVPFVVYGKANDGWYFKGWSYTQDGTDLASIGKQSHFDGQIGVLVDPSKQEGVENAKPYTIYATFEKIYVSDYVVSGVNTVAKNGSTTQTVTFNLIGEDIDENDFNAPSIVSTTGSGAWSSADGDALTISDVSINTSSKQASIEVKFAAPDEDNVESKAVLRFCSKSGSQLNVTLSARTNSSSEVEAFLYNGQTKIGEGDVANLLTTDVSAYNNPIVKLNKNFEGTITIAKKIALDLNGYTLGGLKVNNGGDASLAYSSFGGSITGTLNVTGGKLILNGGAINNTVTISENAELILNGAVITAAVNNAGTLTTKDGSIIGALTSSNGLLNVNGGTIVNNAGVAITISGGIAQIKRGYITGSTYGIKTTGGATSVERLAVIRGTTKKALNGAGGTLTVNSGKFADPENMAEGTVSLKSAYFVSNTGSASTILEKTIWRNTSGAEFQEGYLFFAASEADAKAFGLSVCRIGKSFYSSLEDALAFANNTNEEVIIVMENDYTLPAGYYTLPSNATLLVPMKDNQDAGFDVVPRNAAGVNVILNENNKPTKYRKLTLAEGVNLDVHGVIEASGSQLSSNEVYTGAPFGPYGQIQMNQGSKMVMQNGSVLRAWGFVTGSGEIDARRGSKVYELFQLGDWKDFYFSGRGLMANMGTSLGEEIFPITQYYIQNVEAPVKYHPGSNLISSTCVYAYFPANMLGNGAPPMDMNVVMTANSIPIVGVTGDDAMFLMDTNADAENTWVRKWYDASKDQQVYEINSGAHIGKLVIPLVYGFGQEEALLDMNSGKYNLPITNNFKLHLHSGEMAFTQATALLPGSEVEVDKEAIVYVNDATDGVRAGQLYVYDANEWEEYAMGAKARQVTYSPSFDGEPNIRDLENLEDASINVHGTFDTQGGFVYTTETGANIYSSVEDAGTFVFSMQPTDEQKTATIAQVKDVVRNSGSATRATANCNLAYLRNSDAWVANGGSQYQETADAEEGSSFCYLDLDGRGGRWTLLEQRGCFTFDDASDIYYIKPQEYVAVVVTSATKNGDDWTMTGNSDHTFSDAAGAGRLFILITDEAGYCHWWEVEKKNNYYHCIHPDNDTYYEWDGSKWVEKKFTITWKDWNGTTITTYSVPYGTQAEWLSTNPTREKSGDYTYDFTGWSPALGKVTSNVTYTATYEAKQIKYTITFVSDRGMEIERHLLARNEMPVCENEPTQTGYILQWKPAIAAVTGNQTYTATWLEEPPTEYAVTFFDYDGTTKLKPTGEDPYMVAVGAMPTPPAQVNGKPATSEYTYVFDHWAPAIEKVSGTSVKSYTAVYREVPVTYTVIFQNEDGSEIERHEYAYGETPVCSATPTKANTAQYSYSFAWTPQIQTVQGAATYRATFPATPNQYSLTLKCTPSGAAIITGARADYTYGTDATITVTPKSGYNFTGWSDNAVIGEAADGTYSRTVTINGNIELTAIFECPDCEKSTIQWMNENGQGDPIATASLPVGSATVFSGVAPTKTDPTGQYTYTFYGWTTEANGAGTKYKNGMTPAVAAAQQTYIYYACFTRELSQYALTLTSNHPGMGYLLGAGTYQYGTEVTATVTGYDATNYHFDGWYNGETRESTEASYTFTVEGNANLSANFSPVTYTVTWKSENGVNTLEIDDEQAYGSVTAFNDSEPTKDAHSFIGWTTAANGEGSFYAKGATPAVAGDATYYAYFAANTKNLVAEAGGDPVTLGEPKDFNTFTITSNGVTSGQLMDANNLSLLGEAIFKLQPASTIPGRTWYAVAAPWQVDVRTGIYANGNHLNVGVDFDIIEFDAESYATKEASAGNTNVWRYVEENSGVMQPGKLYMIYLASAKSSLEFHKTGGGISTTTLSLTTTSGSGDKANWNAIANPALYHADLGISSVIANTEQDVLQYINGGYTPTSASNLIVGAPIFVQVTTPDPSVSADPIVGASAPYRRAPKTTSEADSRFVIEIARNGQMNDRLIVQTTDEKENTYVIGQDLAKMGVGTKTAQMWMNRYNTKLCKNTVEMENNRAEYPLSIYAPAAGEYVLTAMQHRGNEVLYLTRDGEAIWNLSEGDYVLTLEKGTATQYGLRVSANAPQVTTGVDEAIVDAQGDTRKVLINNQVFIIRGDQVYTIDGQLFK